MTLGLSNAVSLVEASEVRAYRPTTFERLSLACRKQSGASSIGSTDVPGIDGQPKEYTVEVHVDILLELFLIGKKSVVGKSVVEREVRLFSEELWFLRMSTHREFTEIGQTN